MLKRLFNRKRPFVTVVSGLPRSGTSMMMKMLEAGGINPIQDGIRDADTDNPRGYYEFERVKQLDKGDVSWMSEAEGQAIKVISALIKHLPATHDYRVLFMRRDLNEILASQAKMLVNRNEAANVSDAKLREMYRAHIKSVMQWMKKQPNIEILEVDYNKLVVEPQGQTPLIEKFLQGKWDANASKQVVDGSLYRNRVGSNQQIAR